MHCVKKKEEEKKRTKTYVKCRKLQVSRDIFILNLKLFLYTIRYLVATLASHRKLFKAHVSFERVSASRPGICVIKMSKYWRQTA